MILALLRLTFRCVRSNRRWKIRLSSAIGGTIVMTRTARRTSSESIMIETAPMSDAPQTKSRSAQGTICESLVTSDVKRETSQPTGYLS